MVKKTASQKMLEEIERELDKQLTEKGLQVFPIFAIAIKRLYGWDRTKIISCLSAVSDAYDDWDVETTGKSMLQMCEEETEISVTNNANKLWDDVSFLKTNWSEKCSKLRFHNQDQQIRFMAQIRKEQIKWVEPTLYASVFVAMHRIADYGYDDCVKLKDLMSEINKEIPLEDIVDKCYEITKVKIEVKDGCFRYEEC